MQRTLCVLLGLLVGLMGCSDQEGPDSSQIILPEAEPVALNLICPNPEAFDPPEANQIVFDMAYRGLSGPDDEFFVSHSYGYGGEMKETPFIKDVKHYGIKNLHLVYNHEFKGAEISAVQLHKRRAVAFYLDLDGNGKVTANECIAPLRSDTENSQPTRFLTPDFSFTNDQDQQLCSRALLNVRVNKGGSRPQMTWTPASVLVGQTQVGDKSARLVLFPDGLSGVFDRFTWSDVSLQMGVDQMKAKPRRKDLSQLMVFGGRFYRVQLKRPSNDTAALRVVLTEDTSPTGRIQAVLALGDNATGKFSYARITGATPEDNISLALPMTSMALPVGTYRLDGGGIRFGMDQDNQWEVDMSEGPLFTVEQDKENTVSLGKPTLALLAVDNRDRYRTGVKGKITYKQGTEIYLNREVRGQAGESYGRFQTIKNRRRTDVEAHLAITNPKGKQILSKDLEYG